MALKKCKECGAKISTSAAVCPHCGKKKSSKWPWVLLLILVWLGYSSYHAEDVAPVRAKEESSLKDEKSVVSSEAKEKFEAWALNNSAVTYLEYPEDSDWQIWVRLTPDKYTTKKNAEQIALFLARAYRLQTGFEGLVIVTIWDPEKSKVFAKGRLR